ncbi:MAG: phosphoglucosamine mutase [Candidatus Margulisiibacteriota bacterium]|jgi:phosphomannomutase
MLPLIMSTSGTRGIIGENLFPEVAVNISQAFGAYVKSGGGSTIIVGGDTRVSYDMIKNAVVSGLIAVGINVIDIGQVPTPTVQHLIRYHKADGGIVITASHNPIMWNGIKLMSKSASFLNQTEHDEFKKFLDDKSKVKCVSFDQLGKITYNNNALEIHIDNVLSNLDITPLKNSNLKVLIDPNNGTGALVDPLLFEKLGVQYEMINSVPNGIFTHNPEPTKENVKSTIEYMQKRGFDIGFVQDADADRLVILDENGTFIGEDYSFAFCVDYILSKINTPDKKVVVNLSTSMVIEHVAKKYQAEVTYTKIGEPNVTAKLRELNADVGGEGNGGVIYPKIGWGRDSLVGMVVALLYLAETKKTVSGIIQTYPKYLMDRSKIEVGSRDEINQLIEKARSIFQGAAVNDIDGLKFTFDDAWLHIRSSNTEPIVRIFIEASSEARIKELLAKFN